MPTWTYTALHVYGVLRIVDDAVLVRQMLREQVETHEHGRQSEWTMDLPEDYLDKMMQAIVAFEVPMERLKGKYKLSQDRSDADQDSVIQHLSGSPYEIEAEVMRLIASRQTRATG